MARFMNDGRGGRGDRSDRGGRGGGNGPDSPANRGRPGHIRSSSGRAISLAQPGMQTIASQFSVFREGWEQIAQPLFDYQTYPAAGALNFQFFAVQLGQAGKTIQDTNLVLAGQLSADTYQLVDAIKVDYQPAALTSAGVTNFADMFEVMDHGSLDFRVGQKSYLQIAPLKFCPTNTGVSGCAAFATTVAATTLNVDAPILQGERRYINPVMIPPVQSFSVLVAFKALVTVAADARLGVHLDGTMFRRSQ